jgi:hypothetical protein
MRLTSRTHAAHTAPRAPVVHCFLVAVVLAFTIGGMCVLAGGAAHADTAPVTPAATLDAVLANIRTWAMGILAGLATAFLTLGGVRYILGGGDPGEVEKAKTAFKAAGIGYGLAVLAPLVVTILGKIVGA